MVSTLAGHNPFTFSTFKIAFGTGTIYLNLILDSMIKLWNNSNRNIQNRKNIFFLLENTWVHLFSQKEQFHCTLMYGNARLTSKACDWWIPVSRGPIVFDHLPVFQVLQVVVFIIVEHSKLKAIVKLKLQIQILEIKVGCCGYWISESWMVQPPLLVQRCNGTTAGLGYLEANVNCPWKSPQWPVD